MWKGYTHCCVGMCVCVCFCIGRKGGGERGRVREWPAKEQLQWFLHVFSWLSIQYGGTNMVLKLKMNTHTHIHRIGSENVIVLIKCIIFDTFQRTENCSTLSFNFLIKHIRYTQTSPRSLPSHFERQNTHSFTLLQLDTFDVGPHNLCNFIQ